jgi:hypothetical protein
MSERRPLVEGLKTVTPTVDPSVERQFVYGSPPKPEVPVLVPKPTAPLIRSPFSTRIRADYAEALKRASLQRELNGTYPFTLQEILEDALEPWLKQHGYIP